MRVVHFFLFFTSERVTVEHVQGEGSNGAGIHWETRVVQNNELKGITELAGSSVSERVSISNHCTSTVSNTNQRANAHELH